MKKATLSSLAAACACLTAWRALAAPTSCVAVLPLVSESRRGAVPDWNRASEIASRSVKGCVLQVDGRALRNILDGGTLRSGDLRDPALLRRIGLLVSADAVVSRFYSQKAGQAAVETLVVDVGSGKTKRARRALTAAAARRLTRAMRASYQGTVVDADKPQLASLGSQFGIDPREAQTMRDAVADDGCAGAQGRVDRIERRLLETKAKLWAWKLKRGGSDGRRTLASAGMSDEALRGDFLSRLDYWSAQKEIPALSRDEVRRLKEMEGRAFGLIRRCDLPR